MTSDAIDFEDLLRRALAPVDPPEHLAERLEQTLVELADLAAEELEGWELAAMRDPRNWVRPATAVVVGATAGGALVVMRARRRQQQRRAGSTDILDAAERTARGLVEEARRLLASERSSRR